MTLTALKARFSETFTPRARFGAVALLTLVGIVALMEITSLKTDINQRLATVNTELAGRQAALQERDWPELMDAGAAALERVEARFWRGDTQGLVSAQILGEVEAAARVARLASPRVNVQLVESLDNGALIFEIEMTARSTNGGFAPFLEAIASADAEIRAREIEWQGGGRPVTVRMIAPALILED